MANISLRQYASLLVSNSVIEMARRVGLLVPGLPRSPISVRNLVNLAKSQGLKLGNLTTPSVVDVTAITGKGIIGPVTSWQTPNGPVLVEHLAGMAPNGDLLVFYWMPGQDWNAVNVSQITGQKLAGPVTSWVTPRRSRSC